MEVDDDVRPRIRARSGQCCPHPQRCSGDQNVFVLEWQVAHDLLDSLARDFIIVNFR